MAELTYIDLGRAPYQPTLRRQEQLVDVVKSAGQERAYLLLVEHEPPVITLGRRGQTGHILVDADQLKAEGIETHETSRGGDVTYHGPGQLVGYPIISLQRRSRDIRRYLRDVEEVLIRLLGRFEIKTRRLEGLTGVWAGDEKIAAIGVAVRRWVTYHGFALNVSPNLSHFDLIVPCGITEKPVTSMQRLLGREISTDEVKQPLIECFVEVFGFDSAQPG